MLGRLFLSGAALAADPLFVNLTSDDGHRAHMAIAFAQSALDAGHPVTIFLNVDAVKIAAKAPAEQRDNRELLEAFVKRGGKVLVCPHCAQYAKLTAADLIEGAQISESQITQQALFAPGGRALSW
jgi:predicted peroxiredoxin